MRHGRGAAHLRRIPGRRWRLPAQHWGRYPRILPAPHKEIGELVSTQAADRVIDCGSVRCVLLVSIELLLIKRHLELLELLRVLRLLVIAGTSVHPANGGKSSADAHAPPPVAAI